MFNPDRRVQFGAKPLKTMLIITLFLMGQEAPTQQAADMKDLKQCEVEAHKFMLHQFPDEVQKRIIFRSAACAVGTPPGKDT